MAAGKTVVATRIGGPPEFVPPEAGILVDPLDVAALARALEAAAALSVAQRGGPRGGRGARRQASGGAGGGDSASSFARSASLNSIERPHAVLDPGLAGERERLLVALADLRRVDALLQAIVPREQRLLDTNTGVVRHAPKPYCSRPAFSIADDERLFVDALELILAADERIEVVGRALDGRAGDRARPRARPGRGADGPEHAGRRRLRARSRRCVADDGTRRVVVLSGSADPGDMEKARAAGAVGYLMKDRIADELVPGVLAAAAA